jgi:hypothetical protein
MDWASEDYTRDSPGTFYTRAPESGTGIYLLDEASRETDPYRSNEGRVPIRPYDARASGRYGYPNRRPEPKGFAGYAEGFNGGAPRRERCCGREGFVGPGVIDSERASGNLAAIYEAGWDERPMHYNPNAGCDWAHLVPSPCDRPYGGDRGGRASKAAFPIGLSQSEGLNAPESAMLTGAPTRECFAGGAPPATAPTANDPCHCGAAQNMQVLKIVLLLLLVVMLAMSLMTSHRIEKYCKKVIKRLTPTAQGPGA